MAFTLTDVLQASFRTSRKADSINDELRRILGLPTRYGPARLAIARSLCSAGPLLLAQAYDDDPGKVIKGDQLFGSDADLATWTALIVERASRNEMSRRDLQVLVAAHWQRGAELLWQEWQDCEQDFDRFVRALCDRAGLVTHRGDAVDASHPDKRLGGDLRPKPVLVRLGNPGTEVGTDQEVTWGINAPGVSPHIAAMGTLGTGKTRTGMDLLRQIKEQSGCAAIVFDLKGDLASDRKLVEVLGAETVNPPNAPVPLDVLRARGNDDQSLTEAALRFRESFARVAESKLGGIQLDALREGARRAFARGGRVRIENIHDSIAHIYDDEGRKPDSMTATFNDLCSFRLFEPKMAPETFFARSWIIDLHGATETVQRLVAFLLFDAIDVWFKRLDDAPIDSSGNRALRLVVAIDEARRVLGYGQPSLIDILRMSRSKGGAVMLISQSPDDFAQEEEDFLQNIGLTFSFQTNAKPGSLKRVFGENVDLAGLGKGVCVTRLPDVSRRRPIRVQAWMPSL